MEAITRDRLGSYTALHLAAERGHLRVVEVLLAKGANTTKKTQSGLTALDLAQTRDKGSVISLLYAVGDSELRSNSVNIGC